MPLGSTGCEGNYPKYRKDAWILGFAFGAAHSELDFGNDIEPEMNQTTVFVTLGHRWGQSWSVRLAAGMVLDGRIDYDGRSHDVGIGKLLAASLSRKLSLSGGAFVAGSITAAVSATTTAEKVFLGYEDPVSFEAKDVRIGVTAGLPMGEVLTPYVLARAFAGPVKWTLDDEELTGSDQHHYQLGVGVNVAFPLDLIATVDVPLLGEPGMSVSFSRELF